MQKAARTVLNAMQTRNSNHSHLSEGQLASLALVYDFLNHYRNKACNLYVRDGDAHTKKRIVKAISSGTIANELGRPRVKGDPWVVAAAAKEVLILYAPIVDCNYYQAFLDASAGSDKRLQAACSVLAPEMARALHELCAHLQQLVNATQDASYKHKITVLFASVLLRSPHEVRCKSDSIPECKGRIRVIEKLLSLPWNLSVLQYERPVTTHSTQPAASTADASATSSACAWKASAGQNGSITFNNDLSICSLKVHWNPKDAPQDEQKLADAFGFAGNVVKAVINYKRNTGIVLFAEANSVSRALKHFLGIWTVSQLKQHITPTLGVCTCHENFLSSEQKSPSMLASPQKTFSDALKVRVDASQQMKDASYINAMQRILSVTWGANQSPTKSTLTRLLSTYGEICKCNINQQAALVLFDSRESVRSACAGYSGPWTLCRLGHHDNERSNRKDPRSHACCSTISEPSTKGSLEARLNSLRQRSVLISWPSSKTPGSDVPTPLIRDLMPLIRELNVLVVHSILRSHTAIFLFASSSDARSTAIHLNVQNFPLDATFLGEPV